MLCGNTFYVMDLDIITFIFESFGRCSYPERLTGEMRVKCHIGRFFYQVGSGIRTSDFSVTDPALLIARLSAESLGVLCCI